MTDEELQAIKARSKAATPGPWQVMARQCLTAWTPNGVGIAGYGVGVADGEPLFEPALSCSQHDAEFIAAARQDVPALVAEIERLRSELGKFDTPYYLNLEESNRRLRTERDAEIERLQAELRQARYDLTDLNERWHADRQAMTGGCSGNGGCSCVPNTEQE